MKLLPHRPRVLALGEPTHHEEVLLELRNDLFAHAGYRTLAVESDCLMGLVVDDYVTTGEGELDDVVARGFSHGLNDLPSSRELVRWMREYNTGRPAAEQVRFAGFDGPLEMTHAASPRAALLGLHAYLAALVAPGLLPCSAETLDDLLGADERWEDQAAIMDPSRSVGQTPEATRLRLLAADLVALLEAETPGLIAASSLSAFERAGLYGRTATGLLTYHHWLAEPAPLRATRLMGQRDSMMAANLLALARRGPVMAYAHNSHLQRDKSFLLLGDLPLEWWSAGSIVGARLGADYAFVATGVGTIRRHGVGTPPPGTLEGLLYERPEDVQVVDVRTLDTAGLEARVSPWFGYIPLDPAQVGGADGLVFVRDL
ncbi:MAG: erythromycin esterase family protein [Nonomuraea sp.]|nr:erythromycin esterase family protein [Nonomuraea sp.]